MIRKAAATLLTDDPKAADAMAIHEEAPHDDGDENSHGKDPNRNLFAQKIRAQFRSITSL